MFFYEVTRSGKEGFEQYEHVYMNVYKGDEPDTADYLFQFTWQSDSNSDHWYAGNFEIRTDRVERIIEAGKIVAKLWPGEGYRSIGEQPSELAAKMGKVLKAKEIFDDPRQGKVYRDQVLPAEWDAWYEDSERMGRTYANYRVMAQDEAEAKRLLMKEFSERDYSGDYTQAWLDAGRPVRASYKGYSWHLPDTRTVEEKTAIER